MPHSPHNPSFHQKSSKSRRNSPPALVTSSDDSSTDKSKRSHSSASAATVRRSNVTIPKYVTVHGNRDKHREQQPYKRKNVTKPTFTTLAEKRKNSLRALYTEGYRNRLVKNEFNNFDPAKGWVKDPYSGLLYNPTNGKFDDRSAADLTHKERMELRSYPRTDQMLR